MNKRLQELAQQSYDYADGLGLGGDEWCDAQMKKFAELIVQECANMLDEDSYMMPELGGYAHDMRQRFGVEI